MKADTYLAGSTPGGTPRKSEKGILLFFMLEALRKPQKCLGVLVVGLRRVFVSAWKRRKGTSAVVCLGQASTSISLLGTTKDAMGFWNRRAVSIIPPSVSTLLVVAMGTVRADQFLLQ